MKKIIVYGGTSLLSIEFIKKFDKEIDEFIVISRNLNKNKEKIILFDEKLRKKIKFHQIDILDLDQTLSFSNSITDNSLEF